MFKNNTEIKERKNFPPTIDDDKLEIIFEKNTDSKFHIPDEYENLYIVSKNEFDLLKSNIKSTQVYPILKNNEEEILDFDTYTIDSQKDMLSNPAIIKSSGIL